MSAGKTEKAKHLTAATNYSDIDGNMKTFTHIDYDLKSRMATYHPSDDEKRDNAEALKQYHLDLISRLMATPASTAPDLFYDFTIRGEGKKTIEWNEVMLRDPGMSLDKIRDMALHMERINNM